MTTTQELIDYYKNLLIIQYHNLPKASGTIGALASEVIADQIYTTVRDAFDIDTAVGVQLEILGSYVGASRQYVGLSLERSFFELPSYGDSLTTAKGMGTYTSYSDIGWGFLDYLRFNVKYTLTDGELRELIKFKSKLNSLDYSIQSIDNLLHEFFGNTLSLIEVDNMFIMYIYNDKDESDVDFFQILSVSKSLPKPSGVQLISIISSIIIYKFVTMGTYTDGVADFIGFSTYTEQAFGSFIRYP